MHGTSETAVHGDGNQAIAAVRRLGRDNAKSEGSGKHVCGEYRVGYEAHRDAVVGRLRMLAKAIDDQQAAAMVLRFAMTVAEERPLDQAIVDAALR